MGIMKYTGGATTPLLNSSEASSYKDDADTLEHQTWPPPGPANEVEINGTASVQADGRQRRRVSRERRVSTNYGLRSSRRSFSRGSLSLSELHILRKAAEDRDYELSMRGDMEVGKTWWGFTKRQWSILFLFSVADLLAGIVYSIQAPFYPEEAEKKGATATEYGFVFGAFELAMFIVAPIYGKFMSKLGARNVFNFCIFITGTCCILFGLLDRVDGSTLFISLSFVIRISEAIGNAGFSTAAFTIIACEFPDSVATTFASLETFFGVGLIVGPTMGGALFQLGGYTLPFAVTGVLMYLTGIFVAFAMPKDPSAVEESGDKQGEGFTVFTILKYPGVLLSAFTIVNAANSIGFLSSTLEPHIREFGLSPVLTGVIFVINGGTYALTAPGWGAVCDRIKEPFIVSLIGNTFVAIGYLFVGPAPFLPIPSTLWLTCVALVIQGLGVGASFVSGFTLALKHAVKSGLPDNVDTYSVVSGLWSSALALGLFVGPSLSGILYDSIGFRNATLFVLIGELLCVSFIIFFILYHKGDSLRSDEDSSDTERTSLIDPKSEEGEQPSSSNRENYGTVTT